MLPLNKNAKNLFFHRYLRKLNFARRSSGVFACRTWGIAMKTNYTHNKNANYTRSKSANYKNNSRTSKPQAYSEEDSLKRSHSVVSNLKLTLISLCTALFFAAAYPLFALFLLKSEYLFFGAGVASGGLAVWFGSMLVHFKR